LGYIQAQVSLSHRWLDPSAPLTPKHCRNSKLHSDEPFCVDLHVRIEKGPKVRSVITIREGDMVSRSAFARFFGSFFAVEQLSRAVRALDEPLPFDQVIIKEELEKRISFVESKNITEDEVAESAQLMKEYLVSKGYTNAEVVASYHVQNPKNIIVYFDIYPGSSYYVKSFRIMPEKFVKYIEKNELSDLMETRGFLKPGRLSYNKINKALEDVKRKLSEKGFRNVQAKIEMVSLDDGGVEVVFNIATGKREFISEIKVINGEEELDKEILPFLRNCNSAKKKINPNNLCQGSALDRDGILSDEKKIANFYINNDFLYAKVFSSLSESEQGYELKFYIYDSRWGKKSKLKMHRQDIKNIIISGNNSISTEVIKRLFPKAKNNNARYDSISLKKGMSLLRESNRFSNIDAKIKVGQENSEDAYFAVHVTQKPSLTLDAALSFSTDQLLSLELELEENNLFYSMLKLNTNLGLGLFWGRQTFLSNKFIWPFMFGSPFRFSLQAPVIVYDDKTSRPKPSRRLQNKVITSLEWRATPFLMPYTRYSLTHIMKQEFPNNLVPRLSAQERFLSIDGLTHVLKAPGKIRGMLKTGLSFIKLDNATDPHSGIDVNSFFEISGGPFIGDPFFTNLGIQNKFYVPLKSTTLAFQFSLMRAFVRPNTKNWDELTEVSAMDNLGGDRRVRGYKEAAISPVHSWLPSDNFGGYFLNTANIEWRFPLTNPEILGSFSGALFVDQGMVLSCRGLSCSQDYSFSQLITKMGFGLSVGAGLRYNLPVGPISLDYAYSPLHNESRVHVQFGYAF
ncbi:MAG: BamA/TamA family outer membrane protein, partial [Myxococcales bacterium]|nr:BamA/TamA family outer membrane protein [Myxococcales bacterium]